MNEEKRKNYLFDLIAIVCLAIFCIAIAPKKLQNDTFYTIRIGEYLRESKMSNLTEDVFSWYDLSYTYPHWLYDIGMSIIYDCFGHVGIYISTVVLSVILGILVYMLCLQKSKSRVISFVVSFGIMYLMQDFVAARAQLVTFILFVLEVYSIECFLEKHKTRYLIYLAIIPLLVANLHCAVFPFCFVLYMPYVAEYLIINVLNLNLDKKCIALWYKVRKFATRFYKNEDKKQKELEKLDGYKEKLAESIVIREERRSKMRANPYKIKMVKESFMLILIILMIATAFEGFLNPTGTGAYTYTYKIYKGNTTSSINEHLPTVLMENINFLASLLAIIIILVFSDTKIRLSDLFMFAGLTYLALKSRRQTSMFALFCGPIFAKLVADMFFKYDAKTLKKVLNFLTGWFGSLVLICLFIIFSMDKFKPHVTEEYIDEQAYPVAVADWIVENLDLENIRIYNEYNYGSYLLFRGIPVFIDSRCDLYTPEFNEDKKTHLPGIDIFSDALNIANLSKSYESKFEEYGITHVVIAANSKLAAQLDKDTNYKGLWYEKYFKVYERVTDKEDTE